MFFFGIFLGSALLLTLVAFTFYRLVKGGNAVDMMSWPIRAIISLCLLGLVGVFFVAGRGGSQVIQLMALVVVLVAAFALTGMWVPDLVHLALGPVLGFMTGGNEQVERRPFFSRAIALRKRGEYPAALAEVQQQLVFFPGDAEGLMLLADIHADDLKDVPAALAVLTEVVTTSGRAASEVALALSRMAALQLNRLNDIAAARETFQRIVANFPHTEAAVTARQHLAHLPGAEQLAERAARPALVVTHHEEKIGLTEDLGLAKLPREELEKQTAHLVAHLDEFPDDWESRETLARLYVDHWQRLDLACDQLERLINQPGATARQVAHWLGDLADVQMKSPDGMHTARLTLERVGQKFPGSQWDEQARARINMLGLDQRAKAAPKTLKLGSYEHNIGLKRGDASIPDPAAHPV